MDFLFPDKNAPMILSRQLRGLIQQIGQTKTKQQEQRIISKEIEIVKQQIQHHINPSDYPDILVKLIYFETLGYNTSFARILPINLCQSPSPYIKKISYLLAAMLVKPGQKLAILMHNTISKDLQSDNSFTVLTVLTMLRYFINQDLAGDILPILRKLLKAKLSMTRRKTILAFYNIYQLFPNEVEDMSSIAIAGLFDNEVPVMLSGLSVVKQLIKADPASYKKHTSKFIEIFERIMDHKLPPEYDYHKVPAPWTQIEILFILQKLGKNDQSTSQLMYDSLDKCMRRCQNIYMHFNKGILQQCIKTVANIYPHQFLLQESQNSLHSFFSQGNNNNIKSFGLAAMIQLAKVRQDTITKWQMLLIECLQSDDITLAQRTISLLIEIADEDNTEIILAKIMSLAEKSTDVAEKRKLIKNSIYLIERFSNEKQIFLRRMNEIFYKFEQFVTDTSINNYLKTILEMVQLQPDFVDMLVHTYIEIIENFRNAALVKVSVWIIGEITHRIYLRDRNSQAVDRSVNAILSCTDEYINNGPIIFTIISSLMKLASIQMTSQHEKIKDLLLKAESQLEYSIYKCGQCKKHIILEFIRIAKYSKALYGSNQLDFDPKMKFLSQYVSDNSDQMPHDFLITKKKSERSQINEFDLLSNDSRLIKKQSLNSQLLKYNRNIFQFKPGHRWGQPQHLQNTTVQLKAQHPPRKQSIGQGRMILRGPHQEKKTKPNIDEKKMKLAKSIFGKKN